MVWQTVDVWTSEYLTSRKASLARLERALSPGDQRTSRAIAELRRAINQVERHREAVRRAYAALPDDGNPPGHREATAADFAQ